MATHARNFGETYRTPQTGAATNDVLAVDRFSYSLGRFIFALPFALFGAIHLMNAEAMAGMVPIPGGIFWIYFTGVAMLLGSIGILTGILGRWAALGIAALMFTFIALVHIPGLRDPERRQGAMVSLLKDMALGGGAIALSGVIHDTKRRRKLATSA